MLTKEQAMADVAKHERILDAMKTIADAMSEEIDKIVERQDKAQKTVEETELELEEKSDKYEEYMGDIWDLEDELERMEQLYFSIPQ